MAKYLSGRSKKTPQSKLTDTRYRYLSVGDAEPNLGDPVAPGEIVPIGQQYQSVSVEGYPGERYWVPVSGGLIPGSISVYDENFLVGGPSSTTQLNFVGLAITAQGYRTGLSNPGIAVTITVFAPGNNQELLFNSSNDFATSSKLKFNTSDGLLTAGDRIIVGTGGTVITTTGVGSVGIGTTNPSQELHVQGDLRLTGTIYDYNNQPGTSTQILVKNNFGGLTWIDQGTIISGAGGTYQNIQFHNNAGLVDGAPNFVFDEVNSRVGIGSTQPKVLLDVIGVSSFKGGVTVDNLNITGVTTTSTLAVSGTSTTRNLVVTGVTTLGVLTATNAFFTGIVTASKFIGAIDVTNLYVTGVSTFLQKVNINSDLGVTGLTTTQNLQVYQTLNLNQLNVTGVSTFNSQVNINNLSVSGVGTFDNIKLDTNTVSTLVGNLILDSNLGITQINDAVYVNDPTESTSKDTGSIVTEGGVGIEKNLNVGGNVVLGNTSANTVTYNAQVGSGITPSTNGTFNLGGTSNKWDNVYANTFIGAVSGNSDTATRALYADNAGIATNLKGGIASQIPYQTAANTTAFIPNGTLGQILQSNGTSAPSWVNPTGLTVSNASYADNAGIATNLKGGAASQIPYQTAANTTAFIPNGTSGQLLQSNGTSAPSWVNPTGLSVDRASYADNAGIATNLKGGAASQIPYQTAANTTAFIPNGTLGQILQSNGTSVPSWVNPTGLSVDRASYADNAGIATNLKGGAAGSIPYQTAANTTTFLADPDVNGKILTWNDVSNTPVWSDPSSITIGVASSLNVTTDSSSTPRYLILSSTTSGVTTAFVDSNITYTPSTDLLTVTNIKPTSIQDSSGGTGTNNYVLTANGSGGWTWKSVTGSGGAGGIAGITIQDEGSIVGTQLGITTVNFIGAAVTVTSPSTGVVDVTITASSSGAVPEGTIISYAASAAPTGYLKCNGAAISRSTYSSLFSGIGTVFGAGDGSTTFNVPDLRGEFIRGWDDSRGVDTSRSFGSAQSGAIESHDHYIGSGAILQGFSLGESGSLRSGSGGSGSFPGYYSTNSTGGTETRPRNIAILYCIKY